MSQIILNKGQFYKLKQYECDTVYVIVCVSRKTVLETNCLYDYIPSLFAVSGYGRHRKLHIYLLNRYEKGKLVKRGIEGNTTVCRCNYKTIRPLTLKESIAINVLLRQKNYVYNKKTDKLIKLR